MEQKMSDDDLSTKVAGGSRLYMTIWFMISSLVILSIIIQFICVNNFIANEISLNSENVSISVKNLENVAEKLPYDHLITTLIIYMLALFGIEGTRSLIKSFDISGISKEAAHMPAYKRKRLIIMLFTFFTLTVVSIICMLFTDGAKGNYHLESLFYGILFGSTLIAYSDMAPKLSLDIAQNISLKEEMETEREEELGK
jgi:hypothetical protein